MGEVSQEIVNRAEVEQRVVFLKIDSRRGKDSGPRRDYTNQKRSQNGDNQRDRSSQLS